MTSPSRPSVLAEILAHKKWELPAAQRVMMPEYVSRLADLAPARRGFREALLRSEHRPSLIAEIKAASPSQGAIRPDLNPVSVARSYRRAGAECLSVLTDEKYFGGSPENLKLVRAAVDLPILRKDFIFDSYQIDEAVVWGADAVLLIVAMLEPPVLEGLYRHAKRRGLDVLVEIHNEAEAEVAATLNPDLVGINNRNLHDFTTDLGTTARLAGMFPDALVVSESALDSPRSVARVREDGARAVLIGTAFCREPDIEATVRRIMAR